MIQALSLRKELASLWSESIHFLNECCASYPEEEDIEICNQIAAKIRMIRDEIRSLEHQVKDQNAWSRIGDLAEAIRHQYESLDGDVDAVRKYAEEITWQCSIIDSIG